MSELSTKIITKSKVRFFYTNVFEARAMKGQPNSEPKYSVQILIPKSDTALVAQFNAGIEAAKEEGKLKKWAGKIPFMDYKVSGLRDGDKEYPLDPNYAGMYFISAKNKNKPGILSETTDAFGKRLPITDPVDFYSGCWGYVSLNVFPYNNQSNGIAFSLQNILKATKGPDGKDAERVAGGASAEEDFKDFASGEDDFMK